VEQPWKYTTLRVDFAGFARCLNHPVNVLLENAGRGRCRAIPKAASATTRAAPRFQQEVGYRCDGVSNFSEQLSPSHHIVAQP